MVRRMAAPNLKDDETGLPPEEAEIVRECVEYIANRGLTSKLDMPNFLGCISLSLMTTLAINEGMDMREIKALFKKMRIAAQDSAKQFYDGDVEDLGVMEDPRETEGHG